MNQSPTPSQPPSQPPDRSPAAPQAPAPPARPARPTRPTRAPRRRKVPFLVRFRTTLLLTMLSIIGVIVALLLFGRAGMNPEELTTVEPEAELAAAVEGVTSRSEGFDYTQYDEGQPLFRVKSASHSMGRDDSARLQDVEIQLFRPDGEPYLARSEEALYRQRESAAELEGNVRLQGANGLKLWTEKLVVGKQGERVLSPSPVRFEYGERLSGEANRLRMEIPSRLVLLQGQVRLRGRQGPDSVLLEADRGFFEEDQRLLRAEGSVRLTHDRDLIEAQRLSAYLEADRDTLRFLRAKWEVSGRLRLRTQAAGPAPEPMEFASDGASVLLDPTGQSVRKIELEGSQRVSAELRTPDAVAGTIRRVTANYIVGDFAADALGSVQAFGQVHLAELPPGEGDFGGRTPLRSARAERAEATLDAQGSLELMTLVGTVQYQEPEFLVTSRRARINFGQGLAQFLGGPARLVGEEGEVTAQQLVYNRQRNSLVASGQARVALPMERGIPGPMMSTGEGPVWVEAKQTRWNRETDRTIFTGDVRAWRGRDLLLAQEMVVHRPTERLQASGDVRTIWHPVRRQGQERSPAAVLSDTLEVSAEEFSYLGDESRLVYRGEVEILDGPRTMRCEKTDISLDQEERVRRLECLGSAYLEDRSAGRVIEGERALHDPVEGKIRVWGSPVKLRDRRGSQLQGELVIYDVEDQTVQFGRAGTEGNEAP